MKENSIEDRIEEKYTRYLNCETDIIDLTLEEAVFMLEKDKKNHYVDNLLQVAYGMILSDYKRVLKENEDWQKTYQEEKDKQFDLLRENQKLQKENEELKEAVEIYKGQAETKIDAYIDSNYLSKQKIKDKIEKLKEQPLTINEGNKYYYETDAYNKIIIQVLQDLLESEEK